MGLSSLALLALVASAMTGAIAYRGAETSYAPPDPDNNCVTCVDFFLIQDSGSFFPPSITSEAQCKQVTDMVYKDIEEEAAAQGISLTTTPEMNTCFDDKIGVCFELDFPEDGAKLEPYISDRLAYWWAALDSCTASFYNWHVSVSVAGDGCIEVPEFTAECPAAPASFPPNCNCDTGYGATPVAVSPVATSTPGKYKNSTLYCFTLEHVNNLEEVVSGCTTSTAVSKVEMLGNEDLRTKVRGVAVQPAGATGLTYMATSWGSKGSNQMKITPLNWGKDQTNGARACVELDNSVSLDTFCMLEAKCMIYIFDDTRKCCPGYPSS